MEGAHSLEHDFDVTASALDRVFVALRAQRVVLEQILLKPGMILPGASAPRQASIHEVADATGGCVPRGAPRSEHSGASGGIRNVWTSRLIAPVRVQRGPHPRDLPSDLPLPSGARDRRPALPGRGHARIVGACAHECARGARGQCGRGDGRRTRRRDSDAGDLASDRRVTRPASASPRARPWRSARATQPRARRAMNGGVWRLRRSRPKSEALGASCTHPSRQ